MKKLFFVALSVAYVSLACVAANAQSDKENLEEPTIVVTGKAEIAVEPDSAVISVDFTKLDKDLEAARKANEDGVSKMLQIARKYKIPQQDIRTNNISVSMKYISMRDRQKPIYDDDGDEIGTRVFQGYEVSRSVTLKLTKLSEFDALFNEILAAGPTEIDDVSFQSSRLIELRTQAREMAMKAAHEKAKAMAAAIGQTVGKAIKISEGTASDRYISGGVLNSNTMANVTRPVSPTVTTTSNLATFSAGSISVDSSVTVVFRLN